MHKADVVRYCMGEESLFADDVVLVGDRKYDTLGAREVGIPCVGVTYGYGSYDELLQSGATHIVETTQELEKLLLSI